MKVDTERCEGCGVCAEGCPAGAIRVDSVAHVDPALCLDCGACVDECPTGALAMEEADSRKESADSPIPRRSREQGPTEGAALRAVGYPGLPPLGAPTGPGRGGWSPGRRKGRGGYGRRGGRGMGRGGGRRR